MVLPVRLSQGRKRSMRMPVVASRTSEDRNLKLAFALAAAAIGATSGAALAPSLIEIDLESAKTSEAWASCAAQALDGDVEVRNQGDHFWLIHSNGYRTPVARWDFWPRNGGGSRAELRSSVRIETGEARVRSCA